MPRERVVEMLDRVQDVLEGQETLMETINLVLLRLEKQEQVEHYFYLLKVI